MTLSERSFPGLDARIAEWVSSNKDELIELTSCLIRQSTVNQVFDGTEQECQVLLHEVMERWGLETDLYSPEDVPGFREHPAYFPGKDYRHRPNVHGRHRGTGGGRSLLFSSHIDTAVVAPGWSASPWEPYVREGRLYGLGSYDMKGGLAASMMALRCVKELGVPLAGDVIVESVVDEEFGGANGTLAGRLKIVHAAAAIVPEPTNLTVCPAARGGALWRLTFRGNTGLSFNGEAIHNPLFDAGRFLVFLEQHERERSRLPGPSPWYVEPASLPIIPTRLEAGDLSAALCDVGPEVSHLDIWVECYPGVTEEELCIELVTGYREMFGDSVSIPEFAKLIRFLPGSALPPESPILATAIRQTQKVLNAAPIVRGAPFACDSFMFNLYSPTPALVLGPSGANAHAADEFVDLESLYRLTEIYARIIVEWCGPVHD